MPYELHGNCVHKVGETKPLKCYDNHKDALAYLRALEANVPDANDKVIDVKAADYSQPENWAYVPDEKTPSTWKLKIGDRAHVGAAIAALGPNPPHGKGADIPADAKAGVIKRIRAAISKVANDDDDKKAMLDDLAKVKKSLPTSLKWMQPLSQAESNYNAAGGVTGKACSNCRWFIASDMDGDSDCHLVDDWPAPIVSNGLCDRWEARPAPPSPMDNPIPVVIVEPDMMDDDSAEMALPIPDTRKGLLDFITDAVKKALRPETKDEAGFSVFKSAGGKKFWLSRHTGKFIDREDEIIADKAHDEYVARVQKGIVSMPELWTWHKKGTRHGEGIMVWKSGGFVLTVGTFDDTPEGEHAFRFYESKRGEIKNSHMFHYPTEAKQDGVYYAYNTVEITTLPDGAEAFPYTSFEEILPMALTKDQRDFIKGVGGDDMLKRVEAADAKAVADTKTLEALGVQSKAFDNFSGSTIPAPKSDLDALKTVQTDIETRLKTVEGLPEQIKTMGETIQRLTDQVSASQQAESKALEKANLLEQKLQEYTDLKPPASKSSDTLLGDREKAIVETLVQQAKSADTPSVVEKMVGGQPTVTQ